MKIRLFPCSHAGKDDFRKFCNSPFFLWGHYPLATVLQHPWVLDIARVAVERQQPFGVIDAVRVMPPIVALLGHNATS